MSASPRKEEVVQEIEVDGKLCMQKKTRNNNRKIKKAC